MKLNWTLASAGSVFNAIPAWAMAIGDMRANDPADFRNVDAAIHQRIQNHLIPDTSVDVRFETMMPPMLFSEASIPRGARAAALCGRRRHAEDQPGIERRGH